MVRTAPAIEVAEIVITLVPACASVGAVSLIELLPVPFVIVGGVKIALTPVGNPETDNASGPVNPPVTDVATDTITLPFRTSEAVAAPVLTLNPLTITVTTTVGAGDTPPPVPVTVIG